MSLTLFRIIFRTQLNFDVSLLGQHKKKTNIKPLQSVELKCFSMITYNNKHDTPKMRPSPLSAPSPFLKVKHHNHNNNNHNNSNNNKSRVSRSFALWRKTFIYIYRPKPKTARSRRIACLY